MVSEWYVQAYWFWINTAIWSLLTNREGFLACEKPSLYFLYAVISNKKEIRISRWFCSTANAGQLRRMLRAVSEASRYNYRTHGQGRPGELPAATDGCLGVVRQLSAQAYGACSRSPHAGVCGTAKPLHSQTNKKQAQMACLLEINSTGNTTGDVY